MITAARFRTLVEILRSRGHGEIIDWSEALAPPADAEAFAQEVVYVIVNSGMKATVAASIVDRCMAALSEGRAVAGVFGHQAKAQAVERVWANRAALFAQYLEADDKLAFCGTLPFCGPVTRYHLAKNLGEEAIKPDVHLVRLAAHDGIDAHELCARLAKETGLRVGTIDTVLWRACADGIISSTAYAAGGWEAAIRPDEADKTIASGGSDAA